MLQSNSGVGARNGTNSHTINFGFTSASGSLLVFVIFGAVTHAATGWTELESPVSSGELSLFTKTSAGDSSITVTHNGSNYPVEWAVFEFAAGSTVVNTVSVSANDEDFPALGSLPGTPMFIIGARGRTAAFPAETGASTDWGGAPWVERADEFVLQSGTDGSYLTVGYQEGFTGTSITPAPTTTYVGTWSTPDRQKIVAAVDDVGGGGTTQVTSTLDLRWQVLNSVASTVDLRWSVLNQVTSTIDLRWAVRNTVTSTVDLRWAVLSTVTRTIDLQWAVLNSVTRTIDLRWSVSERVTSALDLRWAVLSTVTSPLDVRWAVLSTVTRTIDLQWAVLNQVTSTIDLRWQVEQSAGTVTSTLDIRWQVYERVTSLLDLRWGVLSPVAATLDLRWAVLSSVTSTLDLRWISYARVTSVIDIRWIVDGQVSTIPLPTLYAEIGQPSWSSEIGEPTAWISKK